jgi:hypothetical protein
MDRIYLVHGRDQCRDIVKTIMKAGVPKISVYFMTG